jgi:hypothetical protein
MQIFVQNKLQIEQRYDAEKDQSGGYHLQGSAGREKSKKTKTSKCNQGCQQ